MKKRIEIAETATDIITVQKLPSLTQLPHYTKGKIDTMVKFNLWLLFWFRDHGRETKEKDLATFHLLVLVLLNVH